MSKQKPLENILKPRDGASLITRDQARVELGDCSYSTVRRLEKKGKLRPIRFDEDSDRTKVFYELEQVRAVAKRVTPTLADAEAGLLQNARKVFSSFAKLKPVELFRLASKHDQEQLLREATPEDRAIWGV